MKLPKDYIFIKPEIKETKNKKSKEKEWVEDSIFEKLVPSGCLSK